VTPVAEILHDEIARGGPVRFHRFMDLALYHPVHGYYRRAEDPFGKDGDYYTAEQVQPAFGILIANLIRNLARESGGEERWTVLELGAGRGEMAEFLGEFDYIAVDVGDAIPESMTGVVFANEFFDALPVDVAKRHRDGYRLMRVDRSGEGFRWVEAEEVDEVTAGYLLRYSAEAPDGALVEINLDALKWIERIAGTLDRGCLLAIDYGYRSRELLRFPAGTLMSYRQHRATEDVLAEPGRRDLTAHVNFTALLARAATCGLHLVRLETLGRTILRAGEADEFACLFDGVGEEERPRRMMQLKSLMFGLGETFLTALLRKEERTK